MDEIVEDDRSPKLPLLVDVGVAVLEHHHRQPLVADTLQDRLGRKVDPDPADGAGEGAGALVDEQPRRAGGDPFGPGRARGGEDVVLVPVGILPGDSRPGGEEGKQAEDEGRERKTHGKNLRKEWALRGSEEPRPTERLTAADDRRRSRGPP